MTIEEQLTKLLNPLVAESVFWDTMPDGYNVFPTVILQIVGGVEDWNVDQDTNPQFENIRLLVTVLSARRSTTNALMREVAKAIRTKVGWASQPFGAFTTDYMDDRKLRIAQQQFGISYDF